ncbi:MAG: NusG domain II-containing protein [Bacteroidetes bacterium]|nr:NusG domain II-containing protein [Bacteroidota bacterium]
MDRREFFKLGFLRAKDHARKAAPEMIRKEITPVVLDVSVLTDQVERAEQLADDLLPEYFGERFLRLKQSRLSGMYPGGVLLFEQNRLRDYHDGASMFYTALRELEEGLALRELQTDPVLLRYINIVPAFSRSAEIFHRNRLVQALALHEDGKYEIEGSLGTMVVVVAGQRLKVIAAPCGHKTCVGHPAIITPGQRITCVPNEISIAIGMPM